MNKGKYFKLKPSDAAHLKLDIKNFRIQSLILAPIFKFSLSIAFIITKICTLVPLKNSKSIN